MAAYSEYPIQVVLRSLEFFQRYLRNIRDLNCEILAEAKEINAELDRITANTQTIIENTEELIENTEVLIDNSETIINNTATTNVNLETVIDRLETINETLTNLEGGEGEEPADPCPACIVDKLANIESYLLNSTDFTYLDTNENGLVRIATTINKSTGVVTTVVTDMTGAVISTPITPFRPPHFIDTFEDEIPFQP